MVDDVEVGVDDDEETGICVYSFVLIFPCALAEGFILRAERRSPCPPITKHPLLFALPWREGAWTEGYILPPYHVGAL